MSKKTLKTKKWLVLTVYLVVSIVTGIVAWITGEILFKGLTDRLFTPLGISLYFIILFAFLFVALIIILMKKLPSDVFRRKIHSSGIIFLVVLLVFSLLTGTFEFLYELGNTDIPEPTSLIFLIDDSGSMEGSENYRIQAVNDVMKNSELPFAVYSFSENAHQLRNMKAYQSELTDQDLAFSSYGGTEIISSINDVLCDLENGTIQNAGEYPKILLVSDGGSTSFGLHNIARKCRQRMISISSIGMIGSSESLLKKIAESTGGVYVLCTDVTSLGAEFTKAVDYNVDRNLLSERIVYKNDGLYAFLRVFFLLIMALIWSLLKMMLCSENNDFGKMAYVFSAIICFLAALILEVGNSVGVPSAFLRLVFDVLWSLTLGTILIKKKKPAGVIIDNNPPVVNTGTFNVNKLGMEEQSLTGIKQIGEAVVNNESDGSASLFNKDNRNSGVLDINNSDKNIGGVFGKGTNNGNNNDLFNGNSNNENHGFFDNQYKQ